MLLRRNFDVVFVAKSHWQKLIAIDLIFQKKKSMSKSARLKTILPRDLLFPSKERVIFFFGESWDEIKEAGHQNTNKQFIGIKSASLNMFRVRSNFWLPDHVSSICGSLLFENSFQPISTTNKMGDKVLLHFGAEFQGYFIISHVKLQCCHGNFPTTPNLHIIFQEGPGSGPHDNEYVKYGQHFSSSF